MSQQKKNVGPRVPTTIDDLRECPANPRAISAEALAGLKVSLAMYGDIAGIVWNAATGTLVAGHQRVRALRALYGEGLRMEEGALVAPTGERWAVRVVEWREGLALMANVAANNGAIAGEYTDELADVLERLKAEDGELFLGLRLDELERVEVGAGVPEEVEEGLDEVAAQVAGSEARVRRGDVWVLGEHRLMCGDACSRLEMRELMGTERAAMAFTDPPYNVAYEGAAGSILNDDRGDGFGEFLEAAMAELLRYCDGACYVAMSSSELHTLQRAFVAAGGKWSTFIIWAKSSFTLGRSDYQRQYEPILYGWRRGAERHWCGERDQGDVWSCDKPVRSSLHPTMKPLELVLRALRNSSRPGDVVLDPFGGSGTTLVACEAAGRRARVMELEPRYCDAIVVRWEKFSGRAAAKVGG